MFSGPQTPFEFWLRWVKQVGAHPSPGRIAAIGDLMNANRPDLAEMQHAIGDGKVRPNVGVDVVHTSDFHPKYWPGGDFTMGYGPAKTPGVVGPSPTPASTIPYGVAYGPPAPLSMDEMLRGLFGGG